LKSSSQTRPSLFPSCGGGDERRRRYYKRERREETGRITVREAGKGNGGFGDIERGKEEEIGNRRSNKRKTGEREKIEKER
jgi:hypothetical protein